MAKIEFMKKGSFIGVWREDTFSDEILKNIAAHARAEKGKKVKFTMNMEGLRIIKHRFFKDSVVDFYPLDTIKVVAKNTAFESCVMFIQSGAVKKYKILVLRCESDAEAVYVVNFFTMLRQTGAMKNMEWRKRSDTGNWTLRERSAHNASQHLREVFKEQQAKQATANGDINANNIIVPTDSNASPSNNRKLNGILKQKSETSLPFTDVHKATTTAQWNAGKIASENVQTNDEDVKALMAHTQLAERLAHNDGHRKTQVSTLPTAMPNKPKLQDGKVFATATLVPNSSYSVRRSSGDMALFRQYRPARSPNDAWARGNHGVSFDSATYAKHRPRKTSSLRIVGQQPLLAHQAGRKFSTSTTIHRSIEDTYAKPAILQPQVRMRRESLTSITVPQDDRRQTIHVMGDNLIQVHNGDYDKTF